MSAYRNRILQTELNNLIGYWTLGETLGATANDLSGNNHDGTASSVAWGEAGIGDGNKAAQFVPADSSYIDVHSSALASAFNGAEGTLLLWGRVEPEVEEGEDDVWVDNQVRILLDFNADVNNQITLYKQVNNSLRLAYKAGGTLKNVDHAATPSVFFCLAITWSAAANEMKAYYNGAQIGTTQTGLGTWAGTLANAKLGASGAGTNFWYGMLAHAALWDTALSASQISVLAMQSSAPTIWAVAVDWDRDGSFVTENDDISDWVMSAQWFLGERKPYQDTADNSTLSLTLKNVDKRFSPENASSPLFGKLGPFKPIRLQSNDGLTNRTHWLGWIDRIQPKVNINGGRTVEITASGPMQFLKAAETHIALQENQRTDQIVDVLLQEVVIPPTLDRAWILGRTGNSELSRSTYLTVTDAYSDLDTGATTLAIAGDNWVNRGGANDQKKNTFDVYQAIKDVVAAERGRFFFGRDGKALFWNRHHLLADDTIDATFDNSMSDLDYQYAGMDQFMNEIVVVCHPRALSDSDNELLWQLDEKVRIEAGDTHTLEAKFHDGSGNRIGGKDVHVENAKFWIPGRGSVINNTAVRLEPGANSATLKIQNKPWKPIGLVKCELRGRKITDFDQMEAVATDAASVRDYGRRTLRLNLPSVDNYLDAQNIASFELNRRSQPDGMVGSMAIKSHGIKAGGHHTQQLARTLGDRITIDEDQTLHQGDYHIIGEQHKLSNSATLFETTWYLEAAAKTYPWKLGVEGRSELGQTTTLVY